MLFNNDNHPHPLCKVAALKVHYDNMTPDEKKLARADFIGFRVIPVFAMGFVAAYLTMGMMKY